MRIALAMIGASWAFGFTAQAQDTASFAKHVFWSQQVVANRHHGRGCFVAHYPSLTWKPVQCATAPRVPFIGAHRLPSGKGETVGNGSDWSAQVDDVLSQSTGSFPSVTGVVSESGSNSNGTDYSLQLNSNFFTSQACASSNTGSCQAWAQFIYSYGAAQIFIQNWLLNYSTDGSCPDQSWANYQGSCYKNSDAVNVNQYDPTQLGALSVQGSTDGANITLVFNDGSNAYSLTEPDSTVYLSQGWNTSEYNVFGDGSTTPSANFNSGSTITVQVTTVHGDGSTPVCVGSGTTGEVNNLSLGACGSTDSPQGIQFTESN